MVRPAIRKAALVVVILCISVSGFSALFTHLPAAHAAPVSSLPAAQTAAPAVNWSAHWIWTTSNTANQWVAFRKTFNLSSVPSSVPARIAVDSKYWLYINGNLVTFEGGLKRGPDPSDTYYDEKDIASYLHSGSNTIAVLVWHFGKNGESHTDSGKGGLLFQSAVVVSDTSWKALQHPGYGADSSGSQPDWAMAESNIYYDARNAAAMQNWQNPGYDDSSWPAAVDEGAAGAAPWNNLVLRPIPFFRYSGLQDYTNASSLPTQGTDATPIVATLPSNIQVTVYLKVNAPAGAVIGMQTNHYTDGGLPNIRATYITTGGVQEFEELAWMSGTAVEYTIPSSVQILSLKYRESGYDMDFSGSFSSDDSFFNTLWTKSVRTVYLSTRDNFMDSATRERAQWWGDAVNEQKTGFYVFDTRFYPLIDKAISQLINWQRSNGTLHSPIPGDANQELPAQMLASIWQFSTYYLYTGDSSVISKVYNQVKTYMNLWTFDSDGLVNHRAGDWDWEDWGSNIDARVLDNAWYYLALDSTILMANLSGNSGDVSAWQAKRASIANNFNRVLWNSSNQEYRSPGYTGDTDDRANALAVVAGLANPSQYSAIVRVLQNHYNASPWMEFYALEALYLMGAPDVAQARMKTRYTPEVNDPGYTVWEGWTKGGGNTDDHGWASGPAYAMSAYAAGVRPTQPGYSAYSVIPEIGNFNNVNATVPTVKGNIGVALKRQSDTHFTMSVNSPGGTAARIGVPNLGMGNVTISVNGTTVYANGSATGSVPSLSFAGSDEKYVYFSAAPGTWNFDETGSAPLVLSYEAEASVNTFTGQAQPTSCPPCSGSERVGWVGNGSANTLQFNNVNVPASGNYALTIYYTNGDTQTRSADLSVNGGSAVTIGGFAPTADVNTVNTVTTTVYLNAGNNTLKFSNSSYWAPDFDRITLQAAATSYEAESSLNTFSGQAQPTSCQPCSGGERVGWVGNGAGNTLQFNDIYAPAAGSYALTIYYTNGDTQTRSANLSINGGTATTIGGFVPTGDANTVNTLTVAVSLQAGDNTLKFSNASYWAPDFDRVTLAPNTNLALHKTVSTNSPYENSDWGVSRLTDGLELSVPGSDGYTSAGFASADVSASPVWVDVDLGANRSIDRVTLFPRTDTPAVGGGSADFPVDFTIQVAPDGGSYTTVLTISGQANPNGAARSYSFSAVTARHVRIVATRLGAPPADETSTYRLQFAELEVF